MKILVITNLYPPHFIGGYELACADTVSLLRKNGNDCFVLTSNYDSDRPSDREQNFTRRTLKLHVAWREGDTKVDYLSARIHNETEVERALDEFIPDIVYFWNIFGLTISPAEVVRRRSFRATIHLMDLSLSLYQWTLRRALSSLFMGNKTDLVNVGQYFDAAISISRYVLTKTKTWRFKKNEVIYPFLDHAVPFGQKIEYAPKDPFRGVYLGQIERHKGIVTLCEAIDRINCSNKFTIHLDIYGRSISGLDDDLIKRFGKQITIHSNTQRQDILDSLPDYDVGFFPSFWEEPFGIAQIELMRAGLPVITSAQGGSKEAITNTNAIVFKNGNVADLVSKIYELKSNYSICGPDIGKAAAASVKFAHNELGYYSALEKHMRCILAGT